MKKFEHKILQVPTKGWMKMKQDVGLLEKELTELGLKGWEVVSSLNGVYNSGSNAGHMLVLKREIN